MQNNKLVIWDWYGTLSFNHLYSNLKIKHPTVYEQLNVLFNQNLGILEQWGKGRVKYSELHQFFSEYTSANIEVFNECLKELHVSDYIDKEILEMIAYSQDNGFKHVIATDNTDIWDEYFLANYLLDFDRYFLGIYKPDDKLGNNIYQNEDFYTKIYSELMYKPENVILIDDNKDYKLLENNLGINVVIHNSRNQLITKLNKLFQRFHD